MLTEKCFLAVILASFNYLDYSMNSSYAQDSQGLCKIYVMLVIKKLQEKMGKRVENGVNAVLMYQLLK